LLFFTNIFLFLAVSSENQFYLSFDMPLREHGEQRGDGHGLQTRASKHT
jgi:hypothetical protein